MAMRDHPVSGYKRLLIVDDDSALRRSLAEQLQLHEEFDIGEAASGGEAGHRSDEQQRLRHD